MLLVHSCIFQTAALPVYGLVRNPFAPQSVQLPLLRVSREIIMTQTEHDCVAGESVLKNTGLGYTVIRAGPLMEEPGGYKALIFDQVTAKLSQQSALQVHHAHWATPPIMLGGSVKEVMSTFRSMVFRTCSVGH